MSDRTETHLPPIRYKSSARPWRDIPGLCGYYISKNRPCSQLATHRCKSIGLDGSVSRYGWLCPVHAGAMDHAVKMTSSDLPAMRDGRTCDVWKCQRRAQRWTEDGYAICNHCGGN